MFALMFAMSQCPNQVFWNFTVHKDESTFSLNLGDLIEEGVFPEGKKRDKSS